MLVSRGGNTPLKIKKFLRKKEVVIMTNTNNKLTYKALYNALLEMEEVKANPAYVAKIKDAIEALDNKAKAKSASKTQIANEEIKAEMLELMADGVNYTCMQIVKMLGRDDVTTSQKVTALFTQLIDENKVKKIKDSKTTYFTKA